MEIKKLPTQIIIRLGQNRDNNYYIDNIIVKTRIRIRLGDKTILDENYDSLAPQNINNLVEMIEETTQKLLRDQTKFWETLKDQINTLKDKGYEIVYDIEDSDP